MTSGKPNAAHLLSLLMLVPLSAPAATPDEILARLARPAPATAAFVEVRFSKLLSKPLVTAGELEYRGPGSLGKRIERPYVERTEVEGQDVRVERVGQKPRRFSLDRAPELRGLLVSFGALLGGDRATLEEHFTLGAANEGAGWRLELVPRDPRAQKRIRDVVVHGATDTPRCFVVTEASGNASVLLVGAAAAQALPAVPDRALLDRRCQGDGG